MPVKRHSLSIYLSEKSLEQKLEREMKQHILCSVHVDNEWKLSLQVRL
jgi:hypothetical protein